MSSLSDHSARAQPVHLGTSEQKKFESETVWEKGSKRLELNGQPQRHARARTRGREGENGREGVRK